MTKVEEILHRYAPNRLKVGAENIQTLCPFHGERNPSFSVNRHTGAFICFSCGERGPFDKLLRKLGYGQDERSSILEDVQVDTSYARKATRKIVEEVLIPERLLGLFEYCPVALLATGYDPDILYDNGIGYDKKRRRITFPIRNVSGDLIGLVGRLPEDVAKSYGGRYHPYSEKELGVPVSWRKGDHLWNLHRVVPLNSRTVILCEGFKVNMWIQQAGFPNVVAMMGTSLSRSQQALLTQHFYQVLMFHDDDAPGQESALKCGNQLTRYTNLRVHGVKYPEEFRGKKADDVTPEVISGMIEESVPFSSHTFRSIFKKDGGNT